MRISPIRFFVFAVMGLPIGFIFTALAFAVAELPISAARVLPWTLGIATIAGSAGAIWKRDEDET